MSWEEGPGLIPLRDFTDPAGPRDIQSGLLWMNPSLRFGMMGLGVQVEQLAVICQGLEAMGKALGNNEAGVVRFGQDDPLPRQEGRRVLAQIHGDVVDLPPKTSHHLDLRMRWMLEVEPPDGPLAPGVRVIDLAHRVGESGFLENLRTEQAGERSPVIL